MKTTLTKKQAMRVEIAQDALRWIKPTQVKAHNLYLRDRYVCIPSNITDSKKIAKKLQKSSTCEVCAKGALFLSTVALHNDFDFGLSNVGGIAVGGRTTVTRMYGIFTEAQLELIEIAFETKPNGDEPAMNAYDSFARYKAAMFGFQYEKDITRLRAILKNIITNKGTFKP